MKIVTKFNVFNDKLNVLIISGDLIYLVLDFYIMVEIFLIIILIILF
jgi:hypothetical protein